MYTLSENCPINEVCVQGGKGLTKLKELATPEQMYNHVRLFKHRHAVGVHAPGVQGDGPGSGRGGSGGHRVTSFGSGSVGLIGVP